MRAVVLEEFGKKLVVKEIPIPQPGPGQVLVKMEASPINPSDLAFFDGAYDSPRKPPAGISENLKKQLLASKEAAWSLKMAAESWAGDWLEKEWPLLSQRASTGPIVSTRLPMP
jgi:hypothetical protein